MEETKPVNQFNDERIRCALLDGVVYYSLTDVCEVFANTKITSREYWVKTRGRLAGRGFDVKPHIKKIRVPSKVRPSYFSETEAATYQVCQEVIDRFPKNRKLPRQLELKRIHPLTAMWLSHHGWHYEREVLMPEYGRADFIAYPLSGNKRPMIVECKNELGRDTGRSCAQVIDYCRQYNGFTPALAAPKTKISDLARNVAAYYGIFLIEL